MVDLDDNTLLDLHIYSDLTQTHPIIIIHLKYFKQKVLSTIDGKFTQVRMTLLACPSSNSGYKGIFSRADILQLAVAIRRVSKFFSSCYIFGQYSAKRFKFSAFFFSSTKTAELTQPRSQGLSVAFLFLVIFCAINVTLLDITNLSNFVRILYELAGAFARFRIL